MTAFDSGKQIYSHLTAHCEWRCKFCAENVTNVAVLAPSMVHGEHNKRSAKLERHFCHQNSRFYIGPTYRNKWVILDTAWVQLVESKFKAEADKSQLIYTKSPRLVTSTMNSQSLQW